MKKLALRLLATMLAVLWVWAVPVPAAEKAAPAPAAEKAKEAPAPAPAAETAAPAPEPATEPPKVLGVGDKVVDFVLADGLTGKPVSLLKDYVGKSKLLAITFMNTGCSACNAEIRLLSQLAGKHPELKVIAMAVDIRGEAVVKTYNENNKFNVSYVLDPEYTQPPKYGFNYTPAMLLIDKAGKIVMTKGGFHPMRDGDKVVEAVEKGLK